MQPARNLRTTSREPTVSFIVPAYNYGRYLNECLSSIFRQTLNVPFEVVAIDDASTDETAAILDRWSDIGVHVITHEANRGHAVTFREALELVRGQYVARIDPDDRYRPHFLELTLPAFEEPAVDVVFGHAAMIDACGMISEASMAMPELGQQPRDVLFDLLRLHFIPSPAVIARRSAWLNVEPIPAWLTLDDWYYEVRMAQRGLFTYIEDVLADYRVHDANLHTAIAKAGTGQPSARWIIETALQECGTKHMDALHAASERPAILARHYLRSADQDFWFGHHGSACRNYLSALRWDSSLALRTPVLRRLAATALPPAAYNECRDRVKSAAVFFGTR